MAIIDRQPMMTNPATATKRKMRLAFTNLSF